MCFRWTALSGAAREPAKAAVLDFRVHDYGHECDGAGMLPMRQKMRRWNRAAFMHLRQAAAGSLRPEACRGHAHARESVEARAEFVALLRGLAAWRSGDAGRRHDAVGACEPARRVHGIAATLREGRGVESDRLVQGARDDGGSDAREAT